MMIDDSVFSCAFGSSDDPQLQQMARMQTLLADYALWLADYSPKLGFGRPSVVCSGAGSSSFEDLCEAVDEAQMRALDASIDDLSPAKRFAIHRRYGICAVGRFPRDNAEQLLVEAHVELIASLLRKGFVV